jgi:hypothetical protein
MAIRFTREQGDGASEILTIVRLDGGEEHVAACLDGRRTPYLVEVCAGPKIGDDFVGLYDLDGDQIQIGNASWEAAGDDVPADVIEAVESGWENGTSIVRRLAA